MLRVDAVWDNRCNGDIHRTVHGAKAKRNGVFGAPVQPVVGDEKLSLMPMLPIAPQTAAVDVDKSIASCVQPETPRNSDVVIHGREHEFHPKPTQQRLFPPFTNNQARRYLIES